MIQSKVGRNAIEPRFERPFTTPLFCPCPHPEKRLLNHILGRRVVMDNVCHVTANLLFIPMALGVPVAITGLVYLAISHKPIVTVKRMTSEHMWLGGISREFLAPLPEWTEAD